MYNIVITVKYIISVKDAKRTDLNSDSSQKRNGKYGHDKAVS